MEVSGRKWKKVYYWLLTYIDENKFSENHKLPSESTLCRTLGVSRETVRMAMDELEKENLIRRIRGATYFNREEAVSRDLELGYFAD